jgi:hypothetical protein
MTLPPPKYDLRVSLAVEWNVFGGTTADRGARRVARGARAHGVNKMTLSLCHMFGGTTAEGTCHMYHMSHKVGWLDVTSKIRNLNGSAKPSLIGLKLKAEYQIIFKEKLARRF